MLFQYLCGFKPVFYSTHSDDEPVIFEYVLLRKPILFFCYDLAEYDRGFYLRYPEDLPGEVCEPQEELVQHLRSQDFECLGDRYHVFVEKYMSACDGHSCERIAGLINSYREETRYGEDRGDIS